MGEYKIHAVCVNKIENGYIVTENIGANTGGVSRRWCFESLSSLNYWMETNMSL